MAPSRAAVAPGHRWIPRAAILTSLAVATIAIPLTAGAGSTASSEVAATTVEPAAEPVGPSTFSIVSASGTDEAPPASLAQAVSAEERTMLAASRSEERSSPLPGCDTSTMPQGTNGNLSKDGLCELWGTGTYARADAAVALAALNESYVQTFGVNMGITDGYRTLSSQYTLKSTKGGFAATPGKSEHGWGLAVDLRPETYQSAEKTKWLRANAPLFGWDNPAWARPGGSGATEPWHWEFTEGVEAHGY